MSKFNTATITFSIGDTRISIRDGIQVEPAILEETIQHYGACVHALESGLSTLDEQWSTRNNEIDSLHGEAIVTIYRLKPVMVKTDGYTVPININVFTEATTAQHMLSHVHNSINGLGKFVAKAGKPLEAPNNGASALDEHFRPEDLVNHPDNPRNNQTAPPQQVTNNGLPVLGFPASKGEKVEFGAQYHEQKVVFPVSAVEMKFSQRTGQAEYQFYSLWQGNPSKYPAYGLSVDSGSDYENQDVVNTLSAMALQPQEKRPVDGHVTVYVKAGKTKGGEPTTYYNINSLTFSDVDTPVMNDESIEPEGMML